MYDLIVIGGGPGGYVAAIRAAQNGAKVALVEKHNLGGVCLNWGCIPTKSLLESAHLYKQIGKASDFGINVSSAEADIEKMVDRSRNIVERLVAGVEHLVQKNNITLYRGHGRILPSNGGPKAVSIDSAVRLQGSKIIIATGARNRSLKGADVDGDRVWDCRHAMMSKTIPDSLVVIGGGAIGMEFASFFNAIGSKVTVLEYAQDVLQFADHDIIKYATNAFKKSGIKVMTSSAVESVKNTGSEVVVTVSGNEIRAEKCLVATGVIPNTDDIGLENTTVKLDRGVIVTKDCQTDDDGIYAIGDVTSGPWLAHKAMQEGLRCADHLFGGARYIPVEEKSVPMCVYSMPQIAQIGLTEQQARATDKDISIGLYNIGTNGKAMTEGNAGLVKVILEKDTQIFLGAHLVGEHVTELIHSYALFQHLEGIGEDVYNTIFPHPTLSEVVQEAVMSAIGKPLHA